MVSSEMSQKMAKDGPRLSKNQKFSEHFSIHCCPPFTFLNSKREIVDRKYSICKSGCFYQKKEEDWICCACQKTRIGCMTEGREVQVFAFLHRHAHPFHESRHFDDSTPSPPSVTANERPATHLLDSPRTQVPLSEDLCVFRDVQNKFVLYNYPNSKYIKKEIVKHWH
ncbi:hypothetical protein STEG23_005978 [Scotinomys teguina]